MGDTMSEILDENVQIIDESAKKQSFKNVVADPAFLVAKGKFFGNKVQKKNAREEHVEKLAKAILKVIANHGYALVRSVGIYARLNALDAIEMASTLCRDNTGLRLYSEVNRDKGNLGELRCADHVTDVDAWVFSVAIMKEENKDAGA
jgi:hypothetical protein